MLGTEGVDRCRLRSYELALMLTYIGHTVIHLETQNKLKYQE